MLKLKKYEIKTLYDQQVSKEYAVKLDPLKEGEKASILSDTMLKTMFQNENRLKYSCKLLSYFLDISYEELLANIHLAKNEVDKKKEKDKGERCDYVALIHDSYINIEVNNNSSLETMERNIEYLLRLYSRKVKRDTKYQYTQTIGLNLNNFSFLNHDKIFDIYTLQNNEGTTLTNKLIIIQIYVPNLRRKWYTKGKEGLNELERYLLALIERRIEDAKELGIGDRVMEEYVDESIEVSEDMNFGEAYDKEWALKDEGNREGREENKIEMVKSMFQKGISIPMISEISGLLIEEIERLVEGLEINFGEAYDKEWALKDEGIREGEQNKQIEIAKNLMKLNLSLNDISKATGLSIQQLEQLTNS